MPKEAPKRRAPLQPPTKPAPVPLATPDAMSSAAQQNHAATNSAINDSTTTSNIVTNDSNSSVSSSTAPSSSAANSDTDSSSSSSSSNLQDTESKHSISDAGNSMIPGVGLADAQASLSSNGGAGANVAKPVDGVLAQNGNDVAAQQAQQGAERSGKDTEEEEEEVEQNLSGSVSKAGFEFSGNGDQFRVSALCCC